jgi:hypothetical protein
MKGDAPSPTPAEFAKARLLEVVEADRAATGRPGYGKVLIFNGPAIEWEWGATYADPWTDGDWFPASIEHDGRHLRNWPHKPSPVPVLRWEPRR